MNSAGLSRDQYLLKNIIKVSNQISRHFSYPKNSNNKIILIFRTDCIIFIQHNIIQHLKLVGKLIHVIIYSVESGIGVEYKSL